MERVFKIKVFHPEGEERGTIMVDKKECAEKIKRLLEEYLYIVEVWEIFKWE